MYGKIGLMVIAPPLRCNNGKLAGLEPGQTFRLISLVDDTTIIHTADGRNETSRE